MAWSGCSLPGDASCVMCDLCVWNNHTRCPRGADIAAANDGGHGALHMAGTSSCRRSCPRPHVFILAAMRSFLDIVRLLVRKGAPVWATDKVPPLTTLQPPPSFLPPVLSPHSTHQEGLTPCQLAADPDIVAFLQSMPPPPAAPVEEIGLCVGAT